MTPIAAITANGIALATEVQKRIISVSYHDASGTTADQLVLELDDSDGTLNIPPKGAELTLQLGYKGKALHNKGKFTVDDVEHAGPPDKLIITARSANFREEFKTLRSTHWEPGTTLGALVATIAERYNLAPKVAPDLADVALAQLNQTAESDSAFLNRIGKQFDAVATSKNGYLLFFPKGQGATASGAALPMATITKNQTTDHRYKTADRNSRFTGVTARWYNNDTAQTVTVTVGEAGYTKQIRDPLPDEQQAGEAAKAEWARIQRGDATMSITVEPGRPELVNGQPVALSGWKGDIDAHNWVIEDLNHTVSDSGLVTAVELVTKR
ncbi:hypothetical protein [Spongiibacter tropicus]|uniref:hypothetical protein n=1 Tax=Spongiibacter tropicus TaxID=454602 RepID=UPI0035BE1D61